MTSPPRRHILAPGCVWRGDRAARPGSREQRGPSHMPGALLREGFIDLLNRELVRDDLVEWVLIPRPRQQIDGTPEVTTTVVVAPLDGHVAGSPVLRVRRVAQVVGPDADLDVAAGRPDHLDALFDGRRVPYDLDEELAAPSSGQILDSLAQHLGCLQLEYGIA